MGGFGWRILQIYAIDEAITPFMRSGSDMQKFIGKRRMNRRRHDGHQCELAPG